MTSIANERPVRHAARVGRSEPRLAGIRAWWRMVTATPEPEPVAPEPATVPEPAPAAANTPRPAPAPAPRPELPLEYTPAPPQDVLRNIAHDVTELLGRDVTPAQVLDALDRHLRELARRAAAWDNLGRRSESNAVEAQMDAALLAAAAKRGEGEAELAARAERMAADVLARARRASDPAPTGVLPVITDGMADPREAYQLADTGAGDLEVASPVREGAAPVVVERMVPEHLPRRPKPRPEPGLVHEVHAPGPTTVLPVHGVTQTAVLPVVEAVDDDA